MAIGVGVIAVIAAQKVLAARFRMRAPAASARAMAASTSASLVRFCATTIPPLPVQISQAKASSRWASLPHRASTTPPACMKLTDVWLTPLERTKPSCS